MAKRFGKLIVGDLSGTFIDKYVNSVAYPMFRTFRKLGINVSYEQVRAPMGMRKDLHIKQIMETQEVKTMWTKKFGAPPTSADFEKVFRDYFPLQLEYLRDKEMMSFLPFAKQTIEYARNNGWKIGSTTGFTREMQNVIRKTIVTNGDARYLPDVTVAADDVPYPRPYPDAIFKNVMQLSRPDMIIPMCNVVKVGDTRSDIIEGKNAGCGLVVGIAEYGNDMGSWSDLYVGQPSWAVMSDFGKYEEYLAFSRERLLAAGADVVLDTMEGFPEILSKFKVKT